MAYDAAGRPMWDPNAPQSRPKRRRKRHKHKWEYQGQAGIFDPGHMLFTCACGRRYTKRKPKKKPPLAG